MKVSRLWVKTQKTEIERILQTLRPSQLYRGKSEGREREKTISKVTEEFRVRAEEDVHCLL